MNFFHAIGKRLAIYLSSPIETETHVATSNPSELASTIRRGDILLIEGNSRISSAIKYLTQSTWSHATLYIGDGPCPHQKQRNEPILVEADLNLFVPRDFDVSPYFEIVKPALSQGFTPRQRQWSE